MPKKREAWSSWNYIGTTDGIQNASAKPVFVTYWLNKLQNLKADKEVRADATP
jgi:predicted NAD/FAD-binding protein